MIIILFQSFKVKRLNLQFLWIHTFSNTFFKMHHKFYNKDNLCITHSELSWVESKFRIMLLRLNKVQYHLNEFKETHLIDSYSYARYSCVHSRVSFLENCIDNLHDKIMGVWPKLDSGLNYVQYLEHFYFLKVQITEIYHMGLEEIFINLGGWSVEVVQIFPEGHAPMHCTCITWDDYWKDDEDCQKSTIYPIFRSRRHSVS